MYPEGVLACDCGEPRLDGHLTCGASCCGTQAEAEARAARETRETRETRGRGTDPDPSLQPAACSLRTRPTVRMPTVLREAFHEVFGVSPHLGKDRTP